MTSAAQPKLWYTVSSERLAVSLSNIGGLNCLFISSHALYYTLGILCQMFVVLMILTGPVCWVDKPLIHPVSFTAPHVCTLHGVWHCGELQVGSVWLLCVSNESRLWGVGVMWTLSNQHLSDEGPHPDQASWPFCLENIGGQTTKILVNLQELKLCPLFSPLSFVSLRQQSTEVASIIDTVDLDLLACFRFWHYECLL